MSNHMIIEAIGYIGSAIVLVSFLMTSVAKLRIVNTIGSVIFMIYALIIHTYPTAIMNLCLALINVHFLWKMRHTGKEYDLVRVGYNDQYYQYVLARQYDDIKNCFPGIAISPEQAHSDDSLYYLVTCQAAPAGIVVGKKDGTVFDLLLDYSLPEYRDFSLGQFLMIRLKEEGIEKLRYSGPVVNHGDYLNKMGFEQVRTQAVTAQDSGAVNGSQESGQVYEKKLY